MRGRLDTDQKETSRARDAADAKLAEARSCQDLLRAEDDVLGRNRSITEGLRAQL